MSKIDEKRYYIVCPYGLITGGPDALHQMVYYLRQIGKDAEIAYVKTFSPKTVMSVPKPYSCYTESFVCFSEIKDSSDIVIICSETYIHYTTKFHKAKIYIWWLSVDNNKIGTQLGKKSLYLLGLPLRMIIHQLKYLKYGREIIKNNVCKKQYKFKNERKNITHLCASYYAFDYVSSKTANDAYLCIEPLSLLFLKNFLAFKDNKMENRQNIVLYNPRKSQNFVRCLSNYDKSISFVPLCGFSQIELINMYKKAKLFVDFGPFPGAERMPKEAVLFGCTIITGKNGASAYYGDVPIPNDFKFNASSRAIPSICKQIHFCLDKYDSICSMFNVYRETVINLENNFVKSLQNIFF